MKVKYSGFWGLCGIHCHGLWKQQQLWQVEVGGSILCLMLRSPSWFCKWPKKKRGKGDGKREICGSCISMKFILYVREKESVIWN